MEIGQRVAFYPLSEDEEIYNDGNSIPAEITEIVGVMTVNLSVYPDSENPIFRESVIMKTESQNYGWV